MNKGSIPQGLRIILGISYLIGALILLSIYAHAQGPHTFRFILSLFG